MSTPLDLMRAYRRMSVALDPGPDGRPVPPVLVDVHQYMINRETKSAALNARRARAAVAYDKVSRQVNRDVGLLSAVKEGIAAPGTKPVKVTRNAFLDELHPGLTDDQFDDVKYGKASPEAVAVYLRLAVRYGLATPSTLQRFADDNIGLDCSGFVSQFWIREGLLTGADADMRNARSYNVASLRRSKLTAVRNLDLLVWADGKHIGIIDGAPLPFLAPDPVGFKAMLRRHERAAAKAEQEARRARRRGAVPQPAPVSGPSHVTGPDPIVPPAPAAPSLPVGAPGYVPPEGFRVEYVCTVVESNGGRGLDSEGYVLQAVNKDGVFDARRANGTLQKVYVINWDFGD